MDWESWCLGLASVQALPSSVVKSLRVAGFMDPRRLASLQDEGDDALRKLFVQALGRPLVDEEVDSSVEQLRAVVAEASLSARPAHDSSWAIPGYERQAQAAVSSIARMASLEVQAMKEIARAPPVGKVGVIRWTTKKKLLLAAAGESATARGDVEEEERQRWAMALYQFLIEIGAPSVAADEALGPLAVKRRWARGLRASTLRAKVRVIRKVSKWALRVLGRGWFSSAMDLELYLCDRADEPCGRTVFQMVCGAVAFLERAAEFPEYMVMGSSPGIQSLCKELELEVARGKGVPKKKAPQFLVRLLIALEQMVVEASLPRFVRAYAWLKAVQVWASLRSDDTMGIDTASVKLDSYGLSMVLNRTKTSGPGKAEQVLHAFVSWGSFLEDPQWLEVGLEVWKEIGYDRDFFVAAPTADLEGLSAVAATFEDRSAMSKALLRMMTTDSGQPLIPAIAALQFWKEHSPRCTMPTWTAPLGITQEVARKLGRWRSSECSANYSRQDQLVIGQVQTATAEFIRTFKAGEEEICGDPFGEVAVLAALKQKLGDSGVSAGLIETTVANLSFFKGGKYTPPKLPGLDYRRLPELEDEDLPGDVEAHEEVEHPQLMDLLGDWVPVSLPISPAISEGAYVQEWEGPGEADGEDEGPVPSILPESWQPPDVEDSDDSIDAYVELPSQYATSKTGKTDSRRLHRVGWCWRVPRTDYKVWQEFDEMPANDMYDALCKHCWKNQRDASPARMNSPGSPTTSSSSGDETMIPQDESEAAGAA